MMTRLKRAFAAGLQAWTETAEFRLPKDLKPITAEGVRLLRAALKDSEPATCFTYAPQMRQLCDWALQGMSAAQRVMEHDQIVSELMRYFGGAQPQDSLALVRQLISEAHNAIMERNARSLSGGPLTFSALRLANVQRLPLFKNGKGVLAHSKADGSDWSPAQWLQAVVGELGEYANVRKKFERGDFTAEEYAPMAEKELADVMIYLDILAFRALDVSGGLVNAYGINLGEAVRAKFNEVSDRVGCAVKL